MADTYELVRQAIAKVVNSAGGVGALPKKLRRRARGVVAGKAKVDWSDAGVRLTELGRLVLVARSVLDATAGIDELAEARELLERIIDQDIDVAPDDGQGPKIRRSVATDRVVSVVDPGMRHGRKSSSKRVDGYKAHIVTDHDNELILSVATTAANVPDGLQAAGLVAAAKACGVPVTEMLGDTACGDGDTRVAVEQVGVKVIRLCGCRAQAPVYAAVGGFRMGAAESRVKIALTFDFDGMAPWLQVTTSSPSFISRGEFGPIGVGRIKDVLDEFGVKGSFFTPGHTAVSYPGSVESLVADGHEIGHHGWVHEILSPLSEDEERSIIERGMEALESVAGARPRGFRAPGFDLSNRTVDLLLEYGFSYDSSMMGNDFSPYWCRSGDIASSDERFVFGDPVDVVEIPVAWHLNDVPFFEFVPGVPNLTGLGRPEDVLDIWTSEFSYLYEHVGEGCMVVTMHPQSTGRGHRISLLRQFIEFVLGHQGAGFARADEIANQFRADSSETL